MDVCFDNQCGFLDVPGCCKTDEDCDDNYAVTTDQCVNGKCSWEFTSECAPGGFGTGSCDDDDFCTEDACVQSCPGSPDANITNDGRCLQAVPQAGNWWEAEATCLAWGGHLASAEDTNAWANINALVASTCGATGYWLGGNDILSEGNWVWNDGTETTAFVAWGAGEPNNCTDCCDGQEEDVMEAGEDGSWNDLCTGWPKGCFVCEKPALTECTHTEIPDCCNSNADCIDGNECTFDFCVAGTCVHGPQTGPGCCVTDFECDDGDTCTEDICGSNGKCVYTPSEDCCFPGSTENCANTNTFGTCTGVRTCIGGDEWSECNALNPSEEICDGIDNDCNPDTVCYTVHHGGDSYEVEPVQGTSDVVTFYGYHWPDSSSANTGFETPNRADLLLYRDTDDKVSLVYILDIANEGGFFDSSGGGVTAAIEGATGMGILVYDDILGAGNDEWDYDQATGTGLIEWLWGSCCTDGLAMGYLEGEFCITFTILESGGIEGLSLHSGTGLSLNLEDGDHNFMVCGAP
jgi:hypothetical protein